jgi:hypothetical protein
VLTGWLRAIPSGKRGTAWFLWLEFQAEDSGCAFLWCCRAVSNEKHEAIQVCNSAFQLIPCQNLQIIMTSGINLGLHIVCNSKLSFHVRVLDVVFHVDNRQVHFILWGKGPDVYVFGICLRSESFYHSLQACKVRFVSMQHIDYHIPEFLILLDALDK